MTAVIAEYVSVTLMSVSRGTPAAGRSVLNLSQPSYLQLPDKSIASLVKFYYSWKKTRTKTSVMDRHARKQKREREER